MLLLHNLVAIIASCLLSPLPFSSLARSIALPALFLFWTLGSSPTLTRSLLTLLLLLLLLLQFTSSFSLFPPQFRVRDARHVSIDCSRLTSASSFFPSIRHTDTIDLQDHHAPSAQDQSARRDRRPTARAPHQAETLRDAAHKSAQEQSRSPRAASSTATYNGSPDTDTDTDSDADSDTDTDAANMDVYQQHQHQQDPLAVAQNGGMADDDDVEDDGDLDDDMMDRISSSPSIEDGACSHSVTVTPVAWPRRVSSLTSIPRIPWASLHLHPNTPSPPIPSTRDTDFLQQIRSGHHHLLSGEYAKCSDQDDEDDDDIGCDVDETDEQDLKTKG